MADVASLLVKLGFSANTRPLEGVEKRLDALNSKLRLVAGFEVLRALGQMTDQFGSSALMLENQAAAAGVSAETMQKLQFAAVQAGSGAHALGASMFNLSRQLYQARMGAADAQQSFWMLGISAEQIKGFHSTEEALYAVMDALRRVKDPLKQQALMERTLGGGSRELARFALAGSAAAKESAELARHVGAVVSNADIRRVADAEARLHELRTIFGAIGTTIVAKFSPAIQVAADHLERFYELNRGPINSAIESWVLGAAKALGYLIGVFEVLGSTVGAFVSRHADAIASVLKFAVAARGVAFAISLVGTALGALRTAWSAASSIIAAGPFLAMAAAAGTLLVVLHDLWMLLTTHSLKDAWIVQLARAKGPASDLLQGVMDRVAGAANLVAPGSVGPEVADHPTVNGLSPSDPALQLKVQRAEGMVGGARVLSNMSQSTALPPAYLQRPNYSGIVNQNVNLTATINVPPTLDPKTAANAVREGVTNAIEKSRYNLDDASRRFALPMY